MSVGSKWNIFRRHGFALVSVAESPYSTMELTSTWSLHVPSFIVTDQLLVRGLRAALRRWGDDPIAELCSCSTEPELATAHIDRACTCIRPLHSPARIAFTLVVACRDAPRTAKIRAKPTNALPLLVSAVLVSGTGYYSLWLYLQSSTASDLATFGFTAFIIVVFGCCCDATPKCECLQVESLSEKRLEIKE